MHTLAFDVRYAFRSLRKSPGFTAAVVLTLAIGIGANMAIFQIVNALLLRDLPYAAPGELVVVSTASAKLGEEDMGVSLPDFTDWQRASRSFSGIAAYYDAPFDLSQEGDPERVSGAVVSTQTFQVLGISPVLGRPFQPEEGVWGNHRVVLLSDALWRRRFGADPSIVGREITVQRQKRTVVGVLPPSAHFPEFAELWVPLATNPETPPARDARWLHVVGRLKPGVTPEQARAEMGAITAQLAAEHPETNAETGATVVGLHEYYRGNVAQALVLFLGVTLFVLLIACVNVANLLLARGATRAREIAVRAALGADRGSLLRQLIVEGLVLAGCGAVAGVAVGIWARRLLMGALPVDIPLWVRFAIDARTLGFVLLLTLLSVGLFALVPAFHAARPDLQQMLCGGGRGSTGDRARRRWQHAFVVVQVALAYVLLVGAGMTAKGLLNLQNIDTGFDPRGVVTVQMELPQRAYSGPEARNAFWAQLLDRMRASPGVAEAAIATGLPLAGGSATHGVVVEGSMSDAVAPALQMDFHIVSPRFLEALRVDLVRGRTLAEQDVTPGARVAVLNEAAVAALFGGSDPVGRRMHTVQDSGWMTVVGVVRNVAAAQIGEEPRPAAYTLYPLAAPAQATLVVRAENGAPLVPQIRGVVKELDPALPILKVETMDQVQRRALWQPRLYTWLLGVFGGVALLLAAVGVYGMISYSVRQQTREIGLRRALGALPAQVVRLIVSRGLRLTAIGLGLGVGLSMLLTQTLTAFVYGVRAFEPALFASVLILLLVVAAIASLVPALQATRLALVAALAED
jgi:putative ABC transport system permease protein